MSDFDPELVPLQSADAEMASLGSAIISRPAVETVLEIIGPADCYHPEHRRILAVIAWLWSQGKPVDVFTVPEELEKRGQLAGCGGRAYIEQLVECIPTAAHAAEYAREVQELSVRRQLEEAAEELRRLARDRTQDVGGIVDYAAQTVLAVGRQREGVRWSAAQAGIPAAIRRATGEEVREAGVPTGLQGLDWVSGGLQRSDLILLAGRPGSGKTALALCAAAHAAGAGYPADVFSLEMSERQVWDRILCAQAQVCSHRARAGSLAAGERERLAHWQERLAALPLAICDRADLSPEQIRGEARRRWREHGTRLLVIDYAQRIRTPGRESRNQELGQVARALKSLARELDLPVLCISSLSRPAKGAHDRPTMSALRDSGELEFEADVVLILHRPRPPEDGAPDPEPEMELRFEKHRKGEADLSVPLVFKKSYARFYDADRRYEPPPERERGY